mgnify:CR=1 FL=1
MLDSYDKLRKSIRSAISDVNRSNDKYTHDTLIDIIEALGHVSDILDHNRSQKKV